MEPTHNYTVIGAGHGGKAMAAHLALMGFQVTLFNRNPEHVVALKGARRHRIRKLRRRTERLCQHGSGDFGYG